MKRLRYSPAASPGRGRPLSKNALVRQIQHTSLEIADLRRAKTVLEVDISRHRCALQTLQADLRLTREKLDNLTQPIWDVASIHYAPESGFSPEQCISTWRISGCVNIGIAVDFRHIRALPRGQRESWRDLLVTQFAEKAREHAAKSIRIDVDA